MSLPILDKYLCYGRIPLNYRHQRDGLRDFYCTNWTKLCDIDNWATIDLRSLSVRTNHVRLTDAEIVFTTNTERAALIKYYNTKDKQVHVPGFIVRDNHSGNIYLPQDCYVSS